MRTSWIGLGEIGTAMAIRTARAGHSVTAYARGKGQDALVRVGGRLVDNYLQVAQGCDVLCVCVFSDKQVQQVLVDEGVLAALRPGTVVAIHTTGSPALMRVLGGAAPEGVEVLDATFSGGPEKACNGTLTLIIGGPEHAVECARPVFEAYASNIYLAGPLGAGQTLKLLNNLLYAANLRLAEEALVIAQKQGFATRLTATIIQDCSGMSTAMGQFKDSADIATLLAFAGPYLKKDVATAKEVAIDSGIELGLLALVALSH